MFGRPLPLVFGVSLAVAISGRAPCAQTISIFGDAVPINPIDDGNAVTLGVKFWSSEPGAVSGIRFYRAVKSGQGYIAKLYSADGTLLGSATIDKESSPLPGWQEADFPAPISIASS